MNNQSNAENEFFEESAREEHQHLQNLIAATQENSEISQETQLEKTHLALFQAQQYIASLEEENTALLNQQLALKSILEKNNQDAQQLELVLQQVDLYQESVALLEEENQKLRQQINKAGKEYSEHQQRISESEKNSEQLHKIIQTLKERLEETNLKAKEDFQNAKEALHDAAQELSQSKDQVLKLQNQLSIEQEQKSEALEEAESLQEQFAKLKNRIHDLEANSQNEKKLETSFQELSKEKDLLMAQYAHLEEDSLALQTQLKQTAELHHNTQIQLEEKEKIIEEMQITLNTLSQERERAEELDANLKTAHLHLAKKVKEIALYQEKYEEQKHQLHEMEKTQIRYETKFTDLQHKLDSHFEIEKQLEEKMKKWETQCNEIYEKWQKSEARAEELKGMEAKYTQMQAFLKNMGSLMEPSTLTPEKSMETQSLFDWSSQTPKHKQTFFD